MAFFETKNGKIYYEIHGESDMTLMILNGIMMSSASWKPFLPYLVKHVKVVLVDFFDQGKSDYLDVAYDQTIQSELVYDVITGLELKKVTLLGISYGGEVAMNFVTRFPGMLEHLILANTTAYTGKQLKAIGENWIHAASTYDGKTFFKATIPPIYSTGFYESRADWLDAREKMFDQLFDKKWYEGFIRLVRSAETHDERDNLKCFNVPTLIIGASEDVITPLSCQRELALGIPDSKFLVIENCGHASMYEKPIEFFSSVIGFVHTAGQTFKI